MMNEGASPRWQGLVGSGIGLMVLSVLVSPMIDIFAKLAIAYVPSAEIAAGRFLVQTLVTMPLALLGGRLFSRSPSLIAVHAFRGILLVVGMNAFVFALKTMPVADAIAIFFIEPAILTLLSAIFLREPIGAAKIIACITGFGGSLLVIQPSFAAFGLVALLPALCALTVALFLMLTRLLSQKEAPWSMQFQSSLWALVISAVILFLADGSGAVAFDPVMPSGIALVFMLGVGLSATISSALATFAYRAAPASVLAPLQYLEIVSAAIVAYFVFGDFPDALKWLGIAIIIASGTFIILRGGDKAPPPSEATI